MLSMSRWRSRSEDGSSSTEYSGRFSAMISPSRSYMNPRGAASGMLCTWLLVDCAT